MKEMGHRLIIAGSTAFWIGFVVSVCGTLADFALLSRKPLLATISFYYLCGWGSGLALGALGGVVASLPAAFAMTAGIFALYPLNIFWLAGEPFLSRTSLAADAMVLVAAGLVGLVLHNRAWVRPAPYGWSYLLIGLGLAATGGVGLLRVSAAPAMDRAGQGPDILLLVLDSVRSDHVGFLGYSRATSGGFEPYLPAARVYENAYSTSSWTVPSTLGILGVAADQDAGSGFPRRLTALGYATLLLSDNPHLAGPPAAYHGFEEKSRSVSEWRYKLTGSIAGEILDRARGGSDRGLADRLAEWTRGRRGPVYVHAHLMNPHTPFKFPPIDRQERPGRRIESPTTGQVMTEAERDSIIARYDEGVRTAFAAASRMIETMRSRQRPLLVLLTSDHGELLGEGGKWFHGNGVDQELIRIPLVAWGEGVQAGRVSGLVSNAQLPETILAAAGGAIAPRDLRTNDGVAEVEGGLPGKAAFRIRGSYKVVVSKDAPTRLFFLPGHGSPRDVTAAQPELAKTLAAGLSLSPVTRAAPHLDEATLEALRSLGYVR